MINLICPACGNELQPLGEEYRCDVCSKNYPVRDGIVCLNHTEDRYYVEFERKNVQSLLGDLPGNFDRVLADFLRTEVAPPRLGEYIMGLGRAGWQYLLPVSNENSVLDLGCGWGPLAYSLSNNANKVVAVDSTFERMQLLRLRAAENNKSNIQCICAGDGKYLPFEENSFDVVVINGVLEWVPTEDMSSEPGLLQLQFLQEVRRVLKDSGSLLLGIENRFAWKTWFLQPDGHTDLRFVPWLPRSIASLYSRLVRGVPYRNFLYSEKGYRELLLRAGFSSTDFFVPLPGYHHPKHMVSLDDKKELRKHSKRRSFNRFQKLKQAVRGLVASEFPDAFTIVCSGENRFPSFIERLDQEIDRLGALKSYRINGEMGSVTAIYQSHVLKLPLHQRGESEHMAEFKLLENAKKEGDLLAPISSLLANAECTGRLDGAQYTVVSRLAGISGEELPVERLDVALASVIEVLHKFPQQGDFNMILEVDALMAKINNLVLSGAQMTAVQQLANDVKVTFPDVVVGRIGHEDLKLANVLFDPRTIEVTGIVDWGGHQLIEHPFYDFSFVLVDYLCVRYQMSVEQALQKAASGSFDLELVPLFERFAKRQTLPFSPELIAPLLRYQWLKRLAPLGESVEAKRFDWRYIDGLFELIP